MNRPFLPANRSVDGLRRLRLSKHFRPRLPVGSHSCHSLRTLHSSSASRQQHLLWAGRLLDQTATTFEPLSQSLLLAAGAADDLNRGDVTLLTPATSATSGHSLIPYRTAEPDRLSRVFSIGRNTHAQLGLGFASQEATFGLVRPGFFGTGGVSAVIAGTSQSWAITADEGRDANLVFAWGDDTQGQLGMGEANNAGPPQSHLYPLPRQVQVLVERDEEGSGLRTDATTLSIGLDHAIMARSHQRGNTREHSVYATGSNTDGQAGITINATRKQGSTGLPVGTLLSDFQRVLKQQDSDPLRSKGHWRVAAGGDSSYAWIKNGDQTRVWAWGNNEYSQCLVSDVHPEDSRPGNTAAPLVPDQLPRPVEVTNIVQEAIGADRSLEDVKVGGSWVAMLDDAGHVYTAGFGALGRPLDDKMRAASLRKVEGLPQIATISTNLDAVLAVSRCRQRLFAWGLEREWGNLGLGNPAVESEDGAGVSVAGLRRMQTPQEIDLTDWMHSGASVKAAVCGGDHSWILIEDDIEPRTAWRGRADQE